MDIFPDTRGKKPRDFVTDGAWPDGNISWEPARAVALLVLRVSSQRQSSVRELATRAAITHTTLLNLLHGTAWPDMKTVAKLEEAMQTSLWARWPPPNREENESLLVRYLDWIDVPREVAPAVRYPTPGGLLFPLDAYYREIGLSICVRRNISTPSRAFELAAIALLMIDVPMSLVVLTAGPPDEPAAATLDYFGVGVVWATEKGFADNSDGILSARRRPPRAHEIRPARVPDVRGYEMGSDFPARVNQVKDQYGRGRDHIPYDPLGDWIF